MRYHIPGNLKQLPQWRLIAQKFTLFFVFVLLALSALAQNTGIKGIVTDIQTKKPLAGASIQVQHSNTFAMAGEKGQFELTALPPNAVLLISSVGYQTATITVGKQSFITISQAGQNNLAEAMVIAYGSSRQYNTGSVGKITAAEIERQPVSNPLATLHGRVAGLILTEPNTGISKAARTMPLMNPQQYLAVCREAFKNDNAIITETNAYDLWVIDTTRYTDLTKELIGGTAHNSTAQLSLSGGSGNIQYRISGGYNTT